MRIFGIFALFLTLIACNKPSPNTITIGTISGPETDLVEVAQNVAQENDFQLFSRKIMNQQMHINELQADNESLKNSLRKMQFNPHSSDDQLKLQRALGEIKSLQVNFN